MTMDGEVRASSTGFRYFGFLEVRILPNHVVAENVFARRPCPGFGLDAPRATRPGSALRLARGDGKGSKYLS
jgi:hypothetical protein